MASLLRTSTVHESMLKLEQSILGLDPTCTAIRCVTHHCVTLESFGLMLHKGNILLTYQPDNHSYGAFLREQAEERHGHL